MFSDMQLFRAIVFVASVIVLLALTCWRRVHPFVAIMAVAAAFGYIALFRISIIVRIFGAGFSEMIYTPGLVIIAASLIAGLAETAGASDRLMAMLGGRRHLRSNWIAAVLGLVAGLGASPSAAFALLLPLLRPIVLYVLVTSTINAFNVFTQVYVMTLGSQAAPGQAVRVLVYDIYQNAFQYFRMGYASAEAVTLTLIVLGFTLIQFRAFRQQENA